MTDATAHLLSLASVAAPLACGYASGRLARRVGRGRARALRWLCVLGALGSPIAAAFVALGAVHVAAWDLLALAALFAVGFAVAARREAAPRPRRLGALSLVTALSLLALELGARGLLGAPPSFPPPGEAQLTYDAPVDDTACDQMYGAPVRPAPSDAPAHAHVLHLGDSMIEAVDGRRDVTYPALLEAMQPGVRHVNTAVASTSTDTQLVALRRWLGLMRPSLVVLSVFLGNDIVEIDAEYPCCHGGPLLLYGPGGATPRCPQPRGDDRFMTRLEHGPPPYALRVATAYSHLARHVAAGIGRVSNRSRIAGRGIAGRVLALQRATAPTDPLAEERWGHFEAALAAHASELRARGIPLLVVVLPFRHELEPGLTASPNYLRAYGGPAAVRQRVLGILRARGIDRLDAFDVLAPVVRRDGPEPWFATGHPGDIHLSQAGHALLARWLLPELERRGVRGRAGPAGR